MTTDADWLRARPEIMQQIAHIVYSRYDWENQLRKYLEDTILKDHRAEIEAEMSGQRMSERAAAHIAGYERAREDAAKVLDDCGFDDLAAAVRSLRP